MLCPSKETKMKQQNSIGLYLAIGAGVGAALSATSLGAAGLAWGMAGGLLTWAIRQWRAQSKS
jgi:hypothetical protein